MALRGWRADQAVARRRSSCDGSPAHQQDGASGVLEDSVGYRGQAHWRVAYADGDDVRVTYRGGIEQLDRGIADQKRRRRRHVRTDEPDRRGEHPPAGVELDA